MAYAINKQSDGDLSLGNIRGELVTLKPAAADYPAGGYLVQSIPPVANGNVGLAKILGVIPVGGQGGIVPVFNPTTSKVQMFWSPAVAAAPAAAVALAEVDAATDLSAYSFQLLLIGL